MVEGARLESVYTRKGIKGSNPLVSAQNFLCGLKESRPGREKVCILERVSRVRIPRFPLKFSERLKNITFKHIKHSKLIQLFHLNNEKIFFSTAHFHFFIII